MKTKLTNSIVKKYGMDAGANVVGVASSSDFGSAPHGFGPTDVLPECLSVIVLGVSFSPETLNDTAKYSTSRNTMLTSMTDIAKKVAKRIGVDGYKTKAISAAGGKWIENNGRKEQFGYISLKHAGEIAGLGVIGKNHLLTNPKYGNLLWLSAVLTDAELMPDEKIQFDICANCNKCVEACPAEALCSIAFFGKRGCSKFFAIENKKFLVKCFLCRMVCPYGFGKYSDQL